MLRHHLHPVVTSMTIQPTVQDPHSDRTTRRDWERPTLTVLPKLSELTLQTGGGIPGSGGPGSGGATVF
jgi:hypothetical protein